MTTPVGSTGSSNTAAPSQPSMTVTQPDGKTFQIPQPKAVWDPVNQRWTTEVTPEMTAQATQINRKYGTTLGADDFMKLLVAQMRFQDPSKPADTTAMMQQTASMAMLERVNELSTNAEAMSKAVKDLTASNDKLMAYYSGQQVEERMSTAVGMIGATIDYTDAKDASKTHTGVVESVKFSKDGPILTVSGQDVPLGSVTAVKSPAGTTAPGSTTTTSGTAGTAGTSGTSTSSPTPSTGTTTATDGTTAPTSTTGSTGSAGTTA